MGLFNSLDYINVVIMDLEDFRKYLQTNTDLRPSSINLYVRTARNYLKQFEDEIKIEYINEFISERFRKSYSFYVVYAFQHFLDWLKKPKLKKKLVRGKPKPRKKGGHYLPDKLIKDIIQAIETEKYRDIAALQYGTGARAIGILTLKEEKIDFDFSPEVIRFKVREKGEKENVKFVVRENYEELLNKYCRGKGGYLFLPEHLALADEEDIEKAVRNEYTYYYQAMNEAAKKFSVEFSTHDLRRNFAEQLKKNKVHPDTARKALGHSRITTTMLYYDESDEDIEGSMIEHQKR